MARLDELKEYLHQRNEMIGRFDFEKLLSADIQKDLENPYDDLESEHENNPLLKSVHDIGDELHNKIKQKTKSNGNKNDYIIQAVMNMNKCTISSTPHYNRKISYKKSRR